MASNPLVQFGTLLGLIGVVVAVIAEFGPSGLAASVLAQVSY
jgi:hypothetical protein